MRLSIPETTQPRPVHERDRPHVPLTSAADPRPRPSHDCWSFAGARPARAVRDVEPGGCPAHPARHSARAEQEGQGGGRRLRCCHQDRQAVPDGPLPARHHPGRPRQHRGGHRGLQDLPVERREALAQHLRRGRRQPGHHLRQAQGVRRRQPVVHPGHPRGPRQPLQAARQGVPQPGHHPQQPGQASRRRHRRRPRLPGPCPQLRPAHGPAVLREGRGRGGRPSAALQRQATDAGQTRRPGQARRRHHRQDHHRAGRRPARRPPGQVRPRHRQGRRPLLRHHYRGQARHPQGCCHQADPGLLPCAGTAVRRGQRPGPDRVAGANDRQGGRHLSAEDGPAVIDCRLPGAGPGVLPGRAGDPGAELEDGGDQQDVDPGPGGRRSSQPALPVQLHQARSARRRRRPGHHRRPAGLLPQHQLAAEHHVQGGGGAEGAAAGRRPRQRRLQCLPHEFEP